MLSRQIVPAIDRSRSSFHRRLTPANGCRDLVSIQASSAIVAGKLSQDPLVHNLFPRFKAYSRRSFVTEHDVPNMSRRRDGRTQMKDVRRF